MRCRPWILGTVLVLHFVALSSTASAQLRWQSDLEQAQALAAQTNRLVVVHFWAPWCQPCLQLDRNVFSQPGLGQAVESSFVPVKLNLDDYPALAREYGVTGIPADVVLTPSGALVETMYSPPTADEYVRKLNGAYTRAQAMVAQSAPVQQGYQASPATTAQAAPYQAAPYQPATQQVAPPTTAPQQAATPPIGPRYASTDRYANYGAAPSQETVPAPQPQGYMPQQPAAPQQQAYSPQPAPYAAPPSQTAPPQMTPSEAAPNYGSPSAPTTDDRYAGHDAGSYPAMPSQQTSPYMPHAMMSQTAPPSQYTAQAPLAVTQQPAPVQDGRYTAQAPTAEPDRYADYDRYASNPHAASPAMPQQPAPAQQQMSDAQLPPAHAPQSMAAQPPMNSPMNPAAVPQSGPGQTLALDGYCPVTLTETRAWQPGDKTWGAVHRGRTYLFAGEEQQRRFLTNPDHYAPVNSGFDPVAMLDQNRTASGFREHGVFYNGRIYLFENERTLDQFSKNPTRYAAEALEARVR